MSVSSIQSSGGLLEKGDVQVLLYAQCLIFNLSHLTLSGQLFFLLLDLLYQMMLIQKQLVNY